MNYFISIAADNVTLRPLVRSDGAAFFRYRSLPEVCRYQSWHPKSLTEIHSFLKKNEQTALHTPGAWLQLGICLNGETLIGDIGIHFVYPDEIEIGYTLAPEFQGKGYASEAATAVVREAFSAWNIRRIAASVDPGNIKSIRLLERLGFREEAHLVKSVLINGEWCDDCVYALHLNEWAAQTAHTAVPAENSGGAVQIEIVETRRQIEEVKTLFIKYTSSLGIDLEYQNFSKEYEDLPGKYAAPDGRLYLARVDGEPSGCVALRRFDTRRAEMKRLYVHPEKRGLQIGRLLAERIVSDARSIGYREILLDTLATMERAQKLYRSLGFVEIEPYYDSPVAGTVYMSLTL